MEQLNLDTGLVTYTILGGGKLRFNPADPNLYSRFVEGAEKLSALERELAEKEGDTVTLFQEADRRMKALLNEIFGGDNDFHKALGGVSLLAVGSNGKTIAQNLFAALEGILEAGAQRLIDARVEDARKSL